MKLYTTHEIEAWVSEMRRTREISFKQICRLVDCDKRNLLKRLRHQKAYPLWLLQAFTVVMNDYYTDRHARGLGGRPVPMTVTFANRGPVLQWR